LHEFDQDDDFDYFVDSRNRQGQDHQQADFSGSDKPFQETLYPALQANTMGVEESTALDVSSQHRQYISLPSRTKVIEWGIMTSSRSGLAGESSSPQRTAR